MVTPNGTYRFGDRSMETGDSVVRGSEVPRVAELLEWLTPNGTSEGTIRCNSTDQLAGFPDL